MKKYILIIVGLLILTNLSNKAEYKWEKFDNLRGSNGYSRIFTVDSNKNLYLMFDARIFKSIDDGKSWLNIFQVGNGYLFDLCSSKNNLYFRCEFAKDYAFAIDSTRIFYSSDFGKTFKTFKFEEKAPPGKYTYYFDLVKNDTALIRRYIYSEKKMLFKAEEDSIWQENYYFPNSYAIENMFLESRTGYIFMPGANIMYMLESVKSDFKGYSDNFHIKFYDNAQNPNLQLFVEDVLGNLYFTSVDSLYQFNYENKTWNIKSIPYSMIYDLRSYNNSIYFLTESNLIVTHDGFKSFDSMKIPFKINSDFSRLYITPKGSLLLLDDTGYLWRGVETSDVKENLVINSFSLSPNPATDFLEISVVEQRVVPLQNIEIFSVLGTRLLSTLVNLTPTLSMLGEGVRIDVSSLPTGIYFVKVRDKVGKFVKI